MRILVNRSGRLPILIVVVLVVLLCGGVGTVVLLRGGKKQHGQEGKSGHAAEVKLRAWKLEEFVVNLADKDEPRYLKASMVLEVSGGKEGGGGHGEGGESNVAEEARARDAAIAIMSRHRFTELLTEGGKARLKRELKDGLNAALEEAQVVSIHFTSFAMQ